MKTMQLNLSYSIVIKLLNDDIKPVSALEI